MIDMAPILLLLHILCAANIHLSSSFSSQEEQSSPFSSSFVWAVELHKSGNEETVAKETGLKYHGRLGTLLSHLHEYRMSVSDHRLLIDKLGSSQAAVKHTHTFLAAHPHVKSAYLQQPIVRKRRGVGFNDPYFKDQWHLVNAREPGHDINVTGLWNVNITGEGVVVAVVDDGLEYTNPEIRQNFNAIGSYDFNGEDGDPTPDLTTSVNTHGTKCAGLVAAVANNHLCGVGVAYKGQVSGIRMLDGTITDLLEAKSLTYMPHTNHIYSCSWGPTDDGMTVEAPGQLAQLAFQLGAQEGRYGYGNIYVFASGNGGMSSDNCNYDGYANSVYTVTIGALDEQDRAPYYAERCAALLAVTYSNGNRGGDRNIVTADINRNGDCTDGFSGTSAAAPMAAGVLALALQVRPCLTWRDVQSLIVYTVLPIDFLDAQWVENRAGFNHSHLHGFGLLDAYRLTMAAKTWQLLPAQVVWSSESQDVNSDIPSYTSHPLTSSIVVPDLPHDLTTLEHVGVTVTVTHAHRGHLVVNISCPSGTQSELATPRKSDRSPAGLTDWTFTTVRCWGESPVGKWTLIVHQDIEEISGTLTHWRLTLYGSNITADEIKDRRRAVVDAVAGGDSIDPIICPPHPNHLNPITFPDNDKRNKILRALSAVAVAVVTFLILYLLLGRLCRRCSEWKRFHSVLPTVRLRKGVESEDGEQDVALLLESRDSKDVEEEEEEEVEERSSGAVSTPLIEKPSESPSLPHEPVASTEI